LKKVYVRATEAAHVAFGPSVVGAIERRAAPEPVRTVE